ncbi:MAG TPA: bifunctional diaminohydroxyphosphoribosylaminopyrimidine deaminase/5-amino-6-(5-phosphoribosylamino)uracil reductase RibD [Elusimicrobia bacterium]|jgi:diaminohydroxyphosphoribosylaminopyrimidine deaminase/5-amino-6-(5-phosphoribosylamino)uracil reductase|nr:bifunctional diaminohydroxyphosphoribosylaminopyrimidine deaminase/5-amino-6-(5-phosphoribosylamino)uracil reductase RibD [Elusimicrobiota bacterium]
MKEYNTAQIAADKKYIRLCLELAKKGIGKVNPNPMVGCVIVKNNKIVGQGYHRYFGGPHAEIETLNKVSGQTKGTTMYINLEPCVHWGKTPPCVPEIVKAGVKKVVIAMKDPNPLVKGKGIQQLKVKSVRCKVGILEKEAKELNRFYIKFITKKMPYVILKSAMTLDGKIATATGESKWITSSPARDYLHRLRSQVDAILVGKNTVIKDNPSLTTYGKGLNPLRVVIDPDLSIPVNSKIFDSLAPTVVVTKNNVSTTKIGILEKKKIKILFLPRTFAQDDSANSKNGQVFPASSCAKVRGLPTKNGKIDFEQIMRELAKMNIASVLIEGGGETNAYALEDDIVDEVIFFIAPKIIGGKDALTPVEGEGIQSLSQALKIKDWKIEKIDTDLLIRGKVASD